MATNPRVGGPTPFARLAIAHAASLCGDVCLTVSLAGSLFFSTPLSSSRPKVLLYLVITMAPFAVVAPLLGPLLDRTKGGRRVMVFVTCASRAVLCFFMARTINSAPPEGLLIFPLAFGMLVMSKSYSIAKSALVPTVVKNREELVNANSRLALISVVAGFVGGAPAVVVYKLSGDNAAWSLGLATIVFIVAAALAWQIPKAEKVDEPLNEMEKEELHAPSIILAGSAMALLRGGVGFLTFFLAFALRDAGEPAWFFGLVIAGSAVGNFLGNLVAPQFRKLTREEIILAGSILTPAVICLLLTRSDGGFGLLASGFIVGFGAALGRVAFDSLLQRDAPDAVRGRAFARFETRFQLTWVVGALLPVAIAPIYEEPRVGLFIIAIVLGFGGLSYLAGMRGAAAAVERRQQRADRAKAVVGEGWRRWRRRSPRADGPPPPPTPSGPPPARRVEPAPARAPADPNEPFPGS
jgi:hypothetical protein